MNNPTINDIVYKLAQQGNSPDLSLLNGDPEGQASLLMALLSDKNGIDTEDMPCFSTNTACSTGEANESEIHKLDSTNDNRNIECTSSPRKIGKKLITSDDDESEGTKKARNRAAQKAFRERKENYVRMLEEKVKELKKMNADKKTELHQENQMLKNIVTKLQSENAALLSSFNCPLSKNQSLDEERPQKVARGNSPHFDSPNSSASIASASRTPETKNTNDFVNFDANPHSNELVCRSELLSCTNPLDGKFTISQEDFDLFSPLDQVQNDDNPENLFKLWNQLSQHPKFNEFDLEHLCNDLKKRAQICKVSLLEELKKSYQNLDPQK
ncbi:hypothetical protein G6F57_003657 [Rhizopus arrhizus]|uniref:BZIP domain-containing protein n=1 Tax=Rhizopus oryzae TaxID=64495 RepID=A0A9P6XGP6_RHIOR|nr:hypothetical protein G6F23_008139 [Rhizopus arrhizus]KAG1428203.1 hypothetical protein G6F58_000675 [Rhizopus delemar]KAG0770160.1 hypothetical protein G6F24_000460 [Rhizopus arrhizus]KAG0788446.1 hypothetical protein G6F22_007005 [Rhizopus arrhizus]KAG0794333.1 hypothetical protein G6F21_002938 [Rhizopus arrhizus]